MRWCSGPAAAEAMVLPVERDADIVAIDVKEGYVSRDAARTHYGVALNDAIQCRRARNATASRHDRCTADKTELCAASQTQREAVR